MANTKVKATNAELLKSIRENASEQYRNMVPDVGKNPTTFQLESAFIGVTSNEAVQNEFINSLINLVGMQYIVNKQRWENPLQVFIKESEIYGDTVAVIAQNLANRQPFRPVASDTNPGEQFKAHLPEAKEMFFSINHKGVFPTTFSDVELRKAFLSADNGLADFTMVQMNNLFNAAKNDEFENTVKVMTDNYKFNGILQVHIEDPTLSDSNARALIKKVRSTVRKMSFYSKDYNKAEMDCQVPVEELYLIITADVEASVDVDVLARAFNMDKTEFMGHVLVVPDFPGTGIQALLCGRDAFVIIRTFYRTYNVLDGLHATRNVFLHDQLIFGFAQFVNAIAFTTDTVYDSGVSAVSIAAAPQTVGKGKTLTITPTVTGDTTNGVYMRVSGATQENTYISDDNILHCSADERVGTKLRVYAYAKKNVEVVSDPLEITVTA